MNSKKYVVYIDEIKVAEFKQLEYAIIMLRGLFVYYFNEPNLNVRIESKIDDVEEVKE